MVQVLKKIIINSNYNYIGGLKTPFYKPLIKNLITTKNLLGS